jgi:hypothetical protein
MTASPLQAPRLPNSPREWLVLAAIYAAAGAILASARGPVSGEDAAWQTWVGLVAEWVVIGGLIGATTHWLTGQYVSYRRAVVSFAVVMPVFMVFVNLVRLLAAWLTGGWERNVTSAAVGALVGVAVIPLATLLFVVLGKALALVLPPAKASPQPAGPKAGEG